MRNSWYPRQHAEYLSTISDLNPRKVAAERDFTFGMQESMPKEVTRPAVDLLTPTPSSRRKTQPPTVRIDTMR